jgi:hypothetical protein
MEDNSKKGDNLDKFLRGAFDKFEATPSQGVWERLQTDLARPQVPAPTAVPAKEPIFWAAAIAIGMLALIGQHLYFSNQLDEIKRELQQQNQKLEVLAARTPTQERTDSNDDRLSNSSINMLPSVPATVYSPNSFTISSNSTKYQIPYNQTNHFFVSNNTAQQETSVVPLLAEAPYSITVDPTSILRPTAKLTFQPVIPVPAKLASFSWNGGIVPRVTLNHAGTTQVQRKASLIVGMHVARAFSTTKVLEKAPQFGPEPPGGEGVFVQGKASRGDVFIAGLTLQKHLSGRWSLVTGLDYTTESVEKNINASLRFEDRDRGHHGGGHHGGGPGGPDPGHGGPNPHDHDFNYLVGTGTGTYLLGVQLTERDSTSMVSEDEVVDFGISTKSRRKSVGIPVGLRYQWQYKHWSVFAQVGLRGNYMLQNTENLQRFDCKNNLFSIKENAKLNPPDAYSKNVARLSADAFVSGGIAYRLGQWSISAAPSFYRPFSRYDDRVSIKTHWVGLNTGVQYHF